MTVSVYGWAGLHYEAGEFEPTYLNVVNLFARALVVCAVMSLGMYLLFLHRHATSYVDDESLRASAGRIPMRGKGRMEPQRSNDEEQG